jgi:hypothetical protein
MAFMDLGVAKHLAETYYPKPIEIVQWVRNIIEKGGNETDSF